MNAKPYRACNCRAPSTAGQDGKRQPGKLLGKRCPRLKTDSRHGAWWVRYEAPADADGKRRQVRLGPFGKEKQASEALAEALAQTAAGVAAGDRNTRVADYLNRWLAWHEPEVKPRTRDSYREAFDLYWIPAIGHMRLGDLRDSHVRDAHATMRKLNTPAEADDRSDLVRRLAAARGTRDGRRYRRRPITEARIRRVTAPLVKALNDCKALPVNPAAGIGGKVRKVRPLLWTAPRAGQWRKTGERPATVMVWTAGQAGAFLDSIADDRLYALYHLAVYYGLRRGELAGLQWADLDLASRRLHVRGDVKSEGSDRSFKIDPATAEVLEAWRERQLFEALEWGDGWTDSGRVFTREDGTALRPGWISEHFGVLVRRTGLPPVRFHDLRHGSASMLLAAGVELKVVSQIMGHATAAFTADVYVTVLEQMEEDAASRIGAFIPRRSAGTEQSRASNVPAEGENEVR
jgi:integrase